MSEQPFSDDRDLGLEAANDTFLMAEGLELLADFRAIKDPEVRTKILELVNSLRRTQAKISNEA